jgi:thiol:disulfide interchange protein DsbD
MLLKAAFFIMLTIVTPHTATQQEIQATSTHNTPDLISNSVETHNLPKQEKRTLSARISSLLTETSSLGLRILFSLILGILLSLTPCIYPMIPITVGILQAGSSHSVFRNFIRASSYACGMATTFAFLGLLSAFTGNLFGSAMSSPWVIGAIILLLMYLAGSMIGLYEMYIPRFLQNTQSSAHGGSLFAAFSFGAASGTVASPCLSPGLLLLISLIAKDGNMLAGFLMLFGFGIGLSIPLLIIGTFSSSLTVLPRAGMWMVEIKRLLGFMMLFMCVYLLKPFVPWHILLWICAGLLFCMYCFYIFKNSPSQFTKLNKLNAAELAKPEKSFFDWSFNLPNVMLGLLLATVVACSIAAYKATQEQRRCVIDMFWLHEFDEAKSEALATHKKILLEITAPYCTICTAIDTKFFCNADVIEQCLTTCVPVKINGADTTHAAHTALQRSLHIIGAPTLILLDPTIGKELKRWGAELYDYDIKAFINELALLGSLKIRT